MKTPKIGKEEKKCCKKCKGEMEPPHNPPCHYEECPCHLPSPDLVDKEEWEIEFDKEYGKANFTGDRFFREYGIYPDIKQFISEVIKETEERERERIVKDCCIACKSMIESKYAKENK